MMKYLSILFLACLLAVLGGCKTRQDPGADARGHTAPTAITARVNEAAGDELPLDDPRDFEEARQGLIASDPDLRVKGSGGDTIWDMPGYAFIQGEAPESVNPSLWRQAKLNNIHGLFEVAPGIYQLRGFDISNMTIIEGKTGWIIVDPLTSKESAAKAISFAREHLEPKPIVAVLYTHSHIDHFGGVLGILSPEEAAKNRVRIIAPSGFMEEATSENILAGIAMGRRAGYQFGRHLDVSERGHVDSGLGKTGAFGSFGILAPTETVDRTPQEMVIDGVRFIFQNTPGSEAPAEFTFYLPDFKAFCGAEVVSRQMHNVYTLRGAKIRDALKWSNYINQAIEMFGDADIYFASHNWPIWGNERILDFLKKQRDLYKYIHDQTLRMANAGLTPREISERIELPESLRTFFSNRGYYGTLRQNAKAVYQGYFGWYDGNPANLNPLPPEETAVKRVEYMGGADAVLQKAQASFDRGEYRWVAQVLNDLIFSDPGNKAARDLLANTYEQLGYQAESGVWRDEYLTAAHELRHGPPKKGIDMVAAMELLRRTPVSRFFDSMAVGLNGPDAEGRDTVVNIVFTDLDESYVLSLENAVLHHRKDDPDPEADAAIQLTHDLFLRMLTGQVGIKETLFSDELETSGNRVELVRFLSLFDKPQGTFPIVTP